MRITFWGATETVTGSRFIVEAGGRLVLVDCGLFQGIKRIRQRNWEPFPVDPSTIDAVLLTHAHIDHSGYLPALVRDGFKGDIWCTEPTAALCRIMLLDAAHLQEEEARYANQRKSSRHHPALPLYTTPDAERSLRQLRPHTWHDSFRPIPELEVRFTPVGHILGAASIWLTDGTTSVAFTGDVGRPVDPVMHGPEPLLAADHVVTESTYGNRAHPANDPRDELAAITNRTLQRGGALLVPVFAVGRAQTVLHLLAELRAEGRIPYVPTYLNSPMAVDATELFCRYAGEHRLTDAQCRAMCQGVTFVRTAEESKQVTPLGGPMIALSASGMASGGRVLHHLERLAPDHRNTILLVGYQAAGTRGEALLAGAREVKIFGEYVPVRAEVARMDTLSAHADGGELVSWLGDGHAPPRGASIVHGEAAAADTFRRTLRDTLGWEADVAQYGEAVDLVETAPSNQRLMVFDEVAASAARITLMHRSGSAIGRS